MSNITERENLVNNRYVRFDPDTDERLEELARRDDRSIASLIRTAVIQYLRRRKI